MRQSQVVYHRRWRRAVARKQTYLGTGLEVADLDRDARRRLAAALERQIAHAVLYELAEQEGEHLLVVGCGPQVFPVVER